MIVIGTAGTGTAAERLSDSEKSSALERPSGRVSGRGSVSGPEAAMCTATRGVGTTVVITAGATVGATTTVKFRGATVTDWIEVRRMLGTEDRSIRTIRATIDQGTQRTGKVSVE